MEKAPYSISHVDFMEVQEKPGPFLRQPQVGQQLRFVDRKNLRRGLCLDNDERIDKNIRSVTDVDPQAIILNWDGELRYDGEPTFSQLMCQAGLVRAFQQPRPKQSVDAHGSVDNLPCAFIQGIVANKHFRALRGPRGEKTIEYRHTAVTRAITPFRAY